MRESERAKGDRLNPNPGGAENGVADVALGHLGCSSCSGCQRAWLTLLLPLGLLWRAATAAPASAPPAGPQLVKVNADETAGPLCVVGVDTGVPSGMCTLIDGFPQGSAADLWMASRFADFDGNGTTWSTDPNFGGVMADLVMDFAAETARLDARKRVTATAQVDLFLCGDEACNTVADLVHVASTADPGAPPTLAFGYQRLPQGLLAIPTRYIGDPGNMSSVLGPATAGTAGAGAAWSRTVGWVVDSPEWISNYPSLMPFGALVRALSVGGNVDWSLVPAGNYVDSRGVCVTLFTPVHPWFDDLAWGTAEDCVSTETYILETFFPQATEIPRARRTTPHLGAYLDLSHFETADDAGANLPAGFAPSSFSTSSWHRHAAVYDALPPSEVTPYRWQDAKWADQVILMGRTLHCKAFDNAVQSAANDTSCVPRYQASPELRLMADAAVSAAFANLLLDLTSAPRLASRFGKEYYRQELLDAAAGGVLAVLKFGSAVVLAISAAEAYPPPSVTWAPGVTLPSSASRLARRSAAQQGDDQTRWQGSSNSASVRRIRHLLHLSYLASTAPRREALPWCDITNMDMTDVQTSSTTISVSTAFNIQYAFVTTPDDEEIYPMYDCDVLWPKMGWGSPATPKRPVPARSGPDLFSLTKRSWADLSTDSDTFSQSCDGTGFAGHNCIVASAVRSGISTAASTAARRLQDSVEAQVVTADFTLTVAGALIAFSLTTVSLIAGYLGRRELVRFFARARLGVTVAKAATVFVTAFALMTYPATIIIAEEGARASNPDGGAGSAAASWVTGDASGGGYYKVVGVMTVAYASVYSTAAYVLAWVNLAVAAVCTTAICVSAARLPYVKESRWPLPRGAVSMQLAECDAGGGGDVYVARAPAPAGAAAGAEDVEKAAGSEDVEKAAGAAPQS
ncbi:hypothetical protein JKP88DRAFT_272172 [Tribonema minus]|uniref:Uncharacterized protein n=1 Tax=Tribonema minus TaxID=303371 RepID=A0A835ZE91_9STRA|nr:hypothetical protein JKP88DRAFT_272172 [Tribonema minus]